MQNRLSGGRCKEELSNDISDMATGKGDKGKRHKLAAVFPFEPCANFGSSILQLAGGMPPFPLFLLLLVLVGRL